MRYIARVEIGNISILCFTDREYLDLLIYLMEKKVLFIANIHE